MLVNFHNTVVNMIAGGKFRYFEQESECVLGESFETASEDNQKKEKELVSVFRVWGVNGEFTDYMTKLEEGRKLFDLLTARIISLP